MARRLPLKVGLEIEGSGRFSAEIERTVYFVASEALTNVVKCSGAESAAVKVEIASTRVAITVLDEGRGGARVTPGGDLGALRDRVAAVGGKLQVTSPTNGGTRLHASLPTATSGCEPGPRRGAALKPGPL